MKHSILLFLLLLTPLFAHAEYIESFTSDIAVHKDASFSVTETLDYRFSEPKHGIFREIPLIHPEKSEAFLKERIIEVELTNVKLDGGDVPYVLESTKDRFIVRVGDANKTITDGHLYTLTYTVRGGLSYPKGQGTELYWNVIGNEWQIPIRVVEATLKDSDGLFMSNRSCYRGVLGATSGSCETAVRVDGSVHFRETEFWPGEGMTVAQALNTTKVAKDIRERTKWVLMLLPLFLIACVYGIYRAYRYKVAFKTNASIIAQYEPYPGMKPMYTGLLMDGRLDDRDITACIVYLAQQGYIKIKKTEKKVLFLFEVDDYEMTLVKVPDDSVGAFEKRVLTIFFDTLTQGTAITLSNLKTNKAEQRQNFVELTTLRSDLSDDLKKAGLYEGMNKKHITVLILGILISIGCIFIPIEGVPVLGFLFTSLIIIGFAILNRRRTQLSYEILDYLEGFKLFLNTTERDRYVFHNAPEKSPEQFMEYLPYAIAFGVEKKWAEVFEGITIPNPNWYDGGSVGAFNATNLTTSLGAFSTAFASSSGTSASSGGGHSGGGGGGGGGGSW